MFPGEKISDKFFVTEMNGIFLIGMPNIWSQKAYVKVFYCVYINFKAAINIFEYMEIAQSVYEGVIKPSYEISTWEDANCASHSSNKRRGSDLSQIHPTMGARAENRKK